MQRGRTFVAVLFTLAWLASPAMADQPSAPPSLSPGQNFTTFERSTREIEHLEGLCQPAARPSLQRVRYRAGPYPGTFTETGR